MREIIITELTQALQELARGFAHYLPRMAVMLIIAFVGWIIAYVLKVVVRSILRLTKFSKLSENAGATQLLNQAALAVLHGIVEPVCFLGGLGRVHSSGRERTWDRRVAGIHLAVLSLPASVVRGTGDSFLGSLAASFFSRAALLAAVNANFRSSRLLSVSIRVIISIFALSMMFEVLGVGEETMMIAFGTAFGAVMLGLALAFGIGGKDLAREFLEKAARREKGREGG